MSSALDFQEVIDTIFYETRAIIVEIAIFVVPL